MSRPLTVRSLSLVLGLAGMAVAQEPPPLEPPSLEPPRAVVPQPGSPGGGPKPSAPASRDALRPALTRPESRPMLAIPGVTAPASRPPAAYRPPLGGPVLPARPAPEAPPDTLPLPSDFRPPDSPGIPLSEPPAPPTLDPPPTRPGTAASRRPSTGSAMSRSGASTPPLGETIPLEIEPIDDKPSGSTGRTPATRSPSGRPPGGGSATNSRPDDDPVGPRSAPRRPPGLFGRLFGPPPAPLPPARVPDRTEDKSRTRRDADAESGLDPDVVARRRIERQIRATLGDRVRSVDVNVTGRNVEVYAQPSRFWLRRSVRRSIETLPALQGYRTRIEVVE